MVRARSAVFVAVGIAVLLASFLVDKSVSENWHDILLAGGVSIISVSIFDFLYHLSGGNPVQTQMKELESEIARLGRTIDVVENAKQSGVTRLYDCTGSLVKEQWLEVMLKAQSRMDLMGRTLHEWIHAPELNDLMTDKIVRDGVQFRWLLMGADNRHLAQLEEDGQLIGESISKKVQVVRERLASIRAALPPAKRELLQVRTFSHVPLHCSVLRSDDKFFVTPYLHSVGSRNSPLIVIEGSRSPWAITYDREFERLWNASTPLAGPAP